MKKKHRCPKCFHPSDSAYPIRERQIQAMPYGSKQTYFKVTIHRIYCPKCKKELADLHMMKESLQSIYRVADNPLEAELSLEKWCKQSLSLDSAYLGKMVKCLRQHWEGVLGFWKYDNLTNAGMEGINNKVRTMIRQAYGFRDEEYMRLKIF